MPIHELFSYLHVQDAAAAIDFYVSVFGAREKSRLTEPSGRIGHAELTFGDVDLLICDEFPKFDIKGPAPGLSVPVTIHLHIDDVDALIDRAVKAGARLEREATDAFYGERSGVVCDPFGHRWNIGHSIEVVTPEEMQRRCTKMLSSGE